MTVRDVMRRTTVALVAALVVAGCSSSDEGTDAAPAISAGPTTAAATATIEQWASLVAPFVREWNDQVDTNEDNCLDPLTVPACVAGYYILGVNAERYVIVLEGAQDNPGVDHYLGEPPAEIAGLVDDTVQAAVGVEPAVTAWQDSDCDDPLSLECGVSESFAMDMAIGDLTDAFDAWAPYL